MLSMSPRHGIILKWCLSCARERSLKPLLPGVASQLADIGVPATEFVRGNKSTCLCPGNNSTGFESFRLGAVLWKWASFCCFTTHRRALSHRCAHNFIKNLPRSHPGWRVFVVVGLDVCHLMTKPCPLPLICVMGCKKRFFGKFLASLLLRYINRMPVYKKASICCI